MGTHRNFAAHSKTICHHCFPFILSVDNQIFVVPIFIYHIPQEFCHCYPVDLTITITSYVVHAIAGCDFELAMGEGDGELAALAMVNILAINAYLCPVWSG